MPRPRKLGHLESVIAQLEQQGAVIDRALEALRRIGGAGPVKRRGRPPGKKTGGMSAEGRARIGEAQRKRWAAKKRGGKRAISAEGRARIAEAARRMWAAKRAAKKKR